MQKRDKGLSGSSREQNRTQTLRPDRSPSRLGIQAKPDEFYFQPEHSRPDLLIALLLGSSSLLLCMLCRYTNLDVDEGIVLQGAQRVFEGQVPYRDFFTFYTPGSYYAIALLFKSFRSSLVVARAELVVCGVIFSALCYLVARRVSTRWSALLAAYAAGVTCLPARFMVTHWDSTLCAYLTLYCGLMWIERNLRCWAVATGCIAALTCLFEQSAGFAVIVGLLTGLGVIQAKMRPEALRRTMVVSALLGFVIPFLVTFAYFTLNHALSAMVADILWPVFHYSSANHTSYGYTATLSREMALWNSGWTARVLLPIVLGPFFTIPLLPILASAMFIWLTWAGRDQLVGQRWSYYVFASGFVLGTLASVLVVRRPDFIHLSYYAPIFYITLAWFVDALTVASRSWRSLAPLVAVYVLISSTAFGLAALTGALAAHQRVSTARGTIRIQDDDHSIDYIQKRVILGERVFIYPYEPLFYYLTGTSSPTRFDFLQLGMHTPEQFRESLQALAADRTRVVLLDISFHERLAWSSPNVPRRLFLTDDPIENYIRANYRPCTGPMGNQYWTFLFMLRKDLACTPATADQNRNVLSK